MLTRYHYQELVKIMLELEAIASKTTTTATAEATLMIVVVVVVVGAAAAHRVAREEVKNVGRWWASSGGPSHSSVHVYVQRTGFILYRSVSQVCRRYIYIYTSYVCTTASQHIYIYIQRRIAASSLIILLKVRTRMHATKRARLRNWCLNRRYIIETDLAAIDRTFLFI